MDAKATVERFMVSCVAVAVGRTAAVVGILFSRFPWLWSQATSVIEILPRQQLKPGRTTLPIPVLGILSQRQFAAARYQSARPGGASRSLLDLTAVHTAYTEPSSPLRSYLVFAQISRCWRGTIIWRQGRAGLRLDKRAGLQAEFRVRSRLRTVSSVP